MSDYQGEKFRAFISKMKENYKDYGFDKKPTNEMLALFSLIDIINQNL